MLFGMQTISSDFKEVVINEKPKTDAADVFVIEKELPKEVEPIVDEPLLEPEIPEEIKEVDVPLETPPEIITPIKKPPKLISSDHVKKPNADINVTHLIESAEKVNEERELKPMSPNVVRTMAIYPGCEAHKGDKRALVNCFSQELGKDILKNLDRDFPETQKDKVAVLLEFHVNTQGEIVNIEPTRGDDEFKSQAKEALEKVAQKMKKRGKLIVPAKMSDESLAILKFQRSVVLEKP